jgi:hypothetical protein
MTRAYVRPTASRVLASTVGMLPASVLVARAIARFAPLSPPAALGLAYALWVPIWLAAACWVACARSGGRAWLIAATTTAAAAACVFAIPS